MGLFGEDFKMSIKQMTLVFNDESIKGNEKLLMLAIADNANDSGVCFPSWSTLMKKTSMSRNSLAKWLSELEGKKLLFRKQRNRKDGSKTSNKFLIYPYQNEASLDHEDLEIFEDLYTTVPKGELGETETQSTKSMTTTVPKGELGEGGRVPKGGLLEPSLNINHQFNHHLYAEIINHLNQTLSKTYKPTTESTVKLIKAKLKDGFTLEDFKKVHITKYAEWSGTDMQKYLRPETLYGAKFESYLNQKLTDNDKYKAVSNHTGMSALEILKQQGYAE